MVNLIDAAAGCRALVRVGKLILLPPASIRNDAIAQLDMLQSGGSTGYFDPTQRAPFVLPGNWRYAAWGVADALAKRRQCDRGHSFSGPIHRFEAKPCGHTNRRSSLPAARDRSTTQPCYPPRTSAFLLRGAPSTCSRAVIDSRTGKCSPCFRRASTLAYPALVSLCRIVP